MSDFQHRKLSAAGSAKANEMAAVFEYCLSKAVELGVDGRHLALVTTKLEEACFFAKKSISLKPENQE